MSLIETIGLLIIGGIFGALIGYFVEALRAPYPVNRFEYFIRMHIKKGKINGKNFKYLRHFEIDKENSDIKDIMEILGCKDGTCKPEKFFSKIDFSRSIKFRLMSLEETNILKVDMSYADKPAELKISFVGNMSKEDGDVDTDLVECNMEFSIEKWSFKDVKDLLIDSRAMFDKILHLLTEDDLHLEYVRSQVTFETKRTPIILSYLEKMGTSKDLEFTWPGREKDMQIYFYDNKCKFINPTSSDDYNDIIKTLVWYV
jgi:hypothetical protein